jgi:uncharacterized protein (TIGR01244 family)
MMQSGVRWAAVALAIAAVGACTGAPPDPNAPRKLTDDVSISGQITVANVKALHDKGFKTIVNMQPDDESPDQAKYKQMQSAAQDAGLGYGYVPVKKGAVVPGTAAEALTSILKRMPKPLLVYGDTPEHPAKTWALAEASRPGGLDAAAILATVKSAGVPADDLASQINTRIAARPKH